MTPYGTSGSLNFRNLRNVLLKVCKSYLSLFCVNKSMVLFIVVYPYNTFSFFTSGYKFESHFRKLNLRKELNNSKISSEVDEILQLYLGCLNNQKSQCRPTFIWYSFPDTNPWRWRNVIFTNNTNMNRKLFLLYIPFCNIKLIYFSKFQHHIFIILLLMKFWIFL